MEILVCSQIFTVSPPKLEYDDTFSPFTNRPLQNAPIITYYGKTREGLKQALHIHKFYPKFYAQIPTSCLISPIDFCFKLEKLFDTALPPIIHNITECYKLSIYGFQKEKTRFFKIEVYNAEHIRRLAEACLDGIDGYQFQPYEAHIDTFQHFYAEYGMTGMDWLTVNKVVYRVGSAVEINEKTVYNKVTKSAIECDCVCEDVQKKMQYIGKEFGNITLPPVYKIWKKESALRAADGVDLSERMIDIPREYEFPQDYIRQAEFLHNYLLVKELPRSGLDFLSPKPRMNEPEVQMNFEDDQKLIDQILEISKPKAPVMTPQKKGKTLEMMMKTPYEYSISKLIERSHPGKARAFYYGMSEPILFKTSMQYAWKPKPPSYNEVKYGLKYNMRYKNQEVYISNRRGDMLAGISDIQILDKVKIGLLPDFALKLEAVQTKPDLFSNQYLYKPQPPSYNYIFSCTQQTSQDSNLNPVKKNINLTPAIQKNTLVLTVVYIEVYVKTRDKYLPDPEFDPVIFVALKIRDDLAQSSEKIIQFGKGPNLYRGKHEIFIEYVLTEKDLLRSVGDLIQGCDADVIVSYEAEKAGIGYLIKRAKYLGSDFCIRASRQIQFIVQQTYRYKKLSSLLTGRVLLSTWRLVKSETHFYSYTIQNVLYSCLEIRFPYYSAENLTRMFGETPGEVYDYIWDILSYSKNLIEHYGILERNVALAQIYGIDYESVFTRGSQFRVEAMLKKQLQGTEYLLLSAMKYQVHNQTGLQCVPLVMEPEKKFWVDPVIVLDFQSLYPSIMIAYNLCYSTCLGKIKAQTYKKFGVTNMRGDVFEDEDIIITPNNIAFVKKNTREGFIPMMMHELLQTRIMVKNSMKGVKKNTSRYHKLFVEQLGIKLLCNTTYGYAGAGETGRMPCNDIADSIVALGRRTLEDAISVVNSNPIWQGKVIYGDTDSMMVSLPGRTIEQAFIIGKEIAAAVTSRNPRPVELILEKVYFPMITLAKKHYAGMKYEKPDSIPYFDAKGIETVRTDYCPLSSKILEEGLQCLFSTRDLTQLHVLLRKSWKKMLANKFPMKEYILYEKVIMNEYKNPPAGVKVSLKNMQIDRMRKPLFGERVGYVIRAGEPGDPVTELAIDPEDFIMSNEYSLNLDYYMEKQVNAVLDRTFTPLGIDIKLWYKFMPKKKTIIAMENLQPSKALLKKNNKRIDKFFKSALCIVCRRPMNGEICEICREDPQKTVLAAMALLNQHERKKMKFIQLCRGCTGSFGDVLCTSLDCPIFYARVKESYDIFTLIKRVRNISW